MLVNKLVMNEQIIIKDAKAAALTSVGVTNRYTSLAQVMYVIRHNFLQYPEYSPLRVTHFSRAKGRVNK